MASSDLLKIIFYAYKDIIEKNNTILEKDNIIRDLENNLQIRKIEALQANGNDIIARLRATWLGRFYTSKVKQYALVRWFAQWIWRNGYPIYVKYAATRLAKTK
jgi:arginine deiminase